MADDYNYVTSTGTIIPDTSTILTDVQNEYKDVFGADLVVTPDTPQGVLITAEALSRAAVVSNNAAVANEINPNLSAGVFLDAIAALTGIQRTAQTQTLVSGVTLTGVAGTTIPVGSQAQTAAGDIFSSLSGVTLDVSGNATVNFASVAYGAIPCAANALTQVVSSVLGWETVNNTVAGVLGQSTQSDQALRALRQNTLAFQGVALAEAITSSLYATAGVTSLSFLENYNGTPMGMLISVTGGATLSGTIWGMTTTGNVIVDTTAMAFALSLQTVPTPNPWPVAAFTTTGNVTLSGLGTQGGGDWGGTLTAGNIILVKNNTTASQNGLWVAASGAWTRQAYNTSASTILGSNSGISMLKNSIYACVAGGSDTNVAAALLENKSSGCGWNGNTTVSLTEPASGQVYPVQFDRPTQVGIVIRVTSSNGDAENITNAVLNYAAGLVNGLTGLVVGADVSPFEISAAIIAQYPSYYISKVEISLQSSISYSTNVIPIGVNQQAFTNAGYITVVTA